MLTGVVVRTKPDVIKVVRGNMEKKGRMLVLNTKSILKNKPPPVLTPSCPGIIKIPPI